MAAWYDYISLIITLALVAAVLYGVLYVSNQTSKVVQSTKEKLKTRGVNISQQGVSVKTQTRLADREEYLDATQRGILKALGSSSVGSAIPNGNSVGKHRSSSHSSRSSQKR